MRRREIIGLSLFAPGFLPAYAALLALGSRVLATATAARNNGMDHAEVYFLGVEGDSVVELGLVLGWMLIGLVGIALIAAGCRLITTTPATAAAPGYDDAPSSRWLGLQV